MLEELRVLIIQSDITPRDLRIVLDIIDSLEEDEVKNNVSD